MDSFRSEREEEKKNLHMREGEKNMSSCNDLLKDVFFILVCVQIINEEYVLLLFEQKTRKEKKSIKNNEQDHG